MTELLVAEGVEKRYGERSVVKTERIPVAPGDAIVVTGPNGSGKSTLLRVLSGVASPSAGKVHRADALRALRMSYVPQAGGLYENLTVLENYGLWRRLYGLHDAPASALGGLAAEFGLEPFLGQRVAELSGGYRKLAAIACALATTPDVVFLDEPLGGVDAERGERVLESLRRAQRPAGFLVVASHAEADLPFANKAIRVSKGMATCVAL
jgi:ABC-type multidrug transport system ATPase subunit